MVVTAEVDALRLAGRLDARFVREVRAALNDRMDSHAVGDIVVDLSAVEMVDATGLGVLTAAHRRLEREGRQLVLRGCSGQVRRVLALTRLQRVLHLA